MARAQLGSRPDYLINGDNLDSRNWKLYKVKLFKLGEFCPPPPYTSGCEIYSKTPVRTDKFALVSSFNYDLWSASYDDLQLGVNKSISLPSGYVDNKSLNIEMINDAYNTINNYLSYYKHVMFPGPNLVRPYRDCCTGIEILLYDKFMGLPNSKISLAAKAKKVEEDANARLDKMNKEWDMTLNESENINKDIADGVYYTTDGWKVNPSTGVATSTLTGRSYGGMGSWLEEEGYSSKETAAFTAEDRQKYLQEEAERQQNEFIAAGEQAQHEIAEAKAAIKDGIDTDPMVFKLAILPTLGGYSLGSEGTNNITVEWKIMGIIP